MRDCVKAFVEDSPVLLVSSFFWIIGCYPSSSLKRAYASGPDTIVDIQITPPQVDKLLTSVNHGKSPLFFIKNGA